MSLSLTLSVPESVCPDGAVIRTTGTSDNPLFRLADVCRVLGKSPTHARKTAASLDTDEKNLGPAEGGNNILAPDGSPEVWYVNEAGLYHVVLTSRAENAAAFRRWVCHDVLPCIRKHGCYPAPAGAPRAGDDGADLRDVVVTLARAVEQLVVRQGRLETVVATLASRPAQVPQLVPTGQPVPIREHVRRLWPTANERQRSRCVSRVIAACFRRGVVPWKPVDPGPWVVQECDLGIVTAETMRVREEADSPLFARLRRGAAVVN